jgi:hypothetical protein
MVLLVKRLIFGCEIVAWELFVVLDEEVQNAITSFKDTPRLDPNQPIAKGGGQRAEGRRHKSFYLIIKVCNFLKIGIFLVAFIFNCLL